MTDDGFAQLDDMLERVRAIPDVVERSMPAIRVGIEAELRAQISRGQAPTGKAWKETKAGEQPLKHAANAITVERNGLTVTVTLTGIEARHHFGWVRGGVKRPILPKEGTIPTGIAEAINDVLEHEFARTTGGAR